MAKVKDTGPIVLGLQTLDKSNLADTSLAKSAKALEVSKQLLEPMLTPSSLITSNSEAFAWLKLSLASFMALAGEGSGSPALGVSVEDTSIRVEGEISYLLFLFRALVPSSSSSLISFSSTRTSFSSTGCRGDLIGGRGTLVSVTRGTSKNVAPSTIVRGGN